MCSRLQVHHFLLGFELHHCSGSIEAVVPIFVPLDSERHDGSLFRCLSDEIEALLPQYLLVLIAADVDLVLLLPLNCADD